ncbi:hypothetical protein ACTXT7_016140 [Hymenolepis weldensis]
MEVEEKLQPRRRKRHYLRKPGNGVQQKAIEKHRATRETFKSNKTYSVDKSLFGANYHQQKSKNRDRSVIDGENHILDKFRFNEYIQNTIVSEEV